MGGWWGAKSPVSQARSPGHPVAGTSYLQTALAEGSTSGSGTNIPFAKDLFCVWLSLSIWLQPLLKYKLANGSSSLCPALRDQLCCCCRCSRSRSRISFLWDYFSVNFASSPNQGETMSVHISHELEAVSRDAQCRKRLLIKEKFTERLRVAASSQVQNWPTVSLGQQGYPERERSLRFSCAVNPANPLKPKKF